MPIEESLFRETKIVDAFEDDADQPMWLRTRHETFERSLPFRGGRARNFYIYKTVNIYTEIEGACTPFSRWLELFLSHGS